jgi:hypothetical protein
MSTVGAGITMSLDGYITGPNDRPGVGLDDSGEPLHYWVFGGPWTYDGPRGTPEDVDNAYLQEVFSNGGAMICGPRMHDVVDGWGDDRGLESRSSCSRIGHTEQWRKGIRPFSS